MIYQTLLSGTAVSNPPKIKTPLGTPSGLSVKIINQTPYELDIYRNEEQIDALPPLSFVILPNLSGMSILLNQNVLSSITQPYSYVAYTTIDQAIPYQTGSTWQENAQSQINNTTSNPAIQQAATGAYSTQESFNETPSTTTTGTWTLLSSTVGGYINALSINYTQSNSGGDTVTIYNGSDIVDHSAAYADGNHSYTFGNGVLNNGITLQYSSNQGYTGSAASGYTVVSQNTPPGVPKVIQ